MLVKKNVQPVTIYTIKKNNRKIDARKACGKEASLHISFTRTIFTS